MTLGKLIGELEKLRSDHGDDMVVMTTCVRGRTDNAARDPEPKMAVLQKTKPGVMLRRFMRPGDCPCIAGEVIIKL